MIHRAAESISALPFKSLLGIGVGSAGTLGVVLGEAITNQWGAAGLSGTIAGALIAIVLVIPKIMEQRRKTRWSASEVREKEIAGIIKRMSELHEREVAFFKRILAERDLIISLERKAKHRIAGLLGSAQTFNMLLTAQLQRNRLDPEVSLKPVEYAEIVGETDDEIEQIRRGSVESAKTTERAQIASATIESL